MRILTLTILLAISNALNAQQAFTGIVTDNSVNSFLASYNPSTIVDSKSKFAISSHINYSRIGNFAANDYLPYGTRSKYKETDKPGYQKTYLNFDILNVKYELNHKNALAYSLRFRTFDHLSGIPTGWSHNTVFDYDSNFVNQPQDLTGFNITKMYFTEHNFTYARVIFDRGTSFLKAGASLKLLNVIDASYFNVNGGTINFTDTSSTAADITDLDANFGSAERKNQLYYKNRGLGLDIGVTYEYRPDFEQQYYEMDGAKRNIRYDINKYKWKISGSITDIGLIRYINDSSDYYNFTLANQTINASELVDVNAFLKFPINYIQDSIQSQGTKTGTQEYKMRMNMPTSLHASFDMNVIRNFYVSYNMSIPLALKNDKTKAANFFIQTLTPRVEKANWSVMMPFSHMGNGKFYVGFAGRFAYKQVSIFAGSNNVSLLYGQKSSLTRNIFAGISYNVLYKVPDDRDHDKISDEKDNCPYDPGLPEYQGCPDTDGDGIIDKEDHCIYDKGPRETHGCPDTDGDGIVDLNDMCPNEKGLPIHYGCPDKDMDGVIDAADRCPDVPGIELNNGCPIEIRGCCLDTDGDGILDSLDKCPEVPGSLYNGGCPITKDNIDKVKLQEEKDKKDANNTKQQVKDNPAIDPRTQLITSKEQMDSLLLSRKVLKNHAVYFDVDQATLTADEQKSLDDFMKSFPKNGKFSIILIGYTDKDGSLDYNLILSKKRAETVQRKLIEYYGFDAKNITIYYYGETKSIHKGSYTEEMKKADRKVEIKLISTPK
jgi:outer membrane protein OmpA-like peptidoglycan-associated protein